MKADEGKRQTGNERLLMVEVTIFHVYLNYLLDFNRLIIMSL